MEVASPLPFGPSSGGTKRSLTCSPQLVDPSNITSLSDAALTTDHDHRITKKRRFHAETSIEALSEDFSSHSIFFKTSITPSKCFYSNQGAGIMKRCRQEPLSPVVEDMKKTVNDQAAAINSLTAEKSALETTLNTLQTEHEKVLKDNQILRRAVSIQQERFKVSENELKAFQKQRAQTDDRIKGLEQMILSLRYHLQAQQSHIGNDFMHQRPPDVF